MLVFHSIQTFFDRRIFFHFGCFRSKRIVADRVKSVRRLPIGLASLIISVMESGRHFYKRRRFMNNLTKYRDYMNGKASTHLLSSMMMPRHCSQFTSFLSEMGPLEVTIGHTNIKWNLVCLSIPF